MEFEDKIEFSLIASIFGASLLIPFFSVFYAMSTALLILFVLALYYVKLNIKDLILVSSLVLFMISALLNLLGSPLVKYSFTVYLFVVSVWVINTAILHSKKYQSLEMVELSLGLLLLLTLFTIWVDLSLVGLPKEGLDLMLPFAICFCIGTLLYNSNLWLRYTPGFQKLLIFVLVNTLSMLLIGVMANVHF
jgi:hypothetical protein